jgi:SNF family Na+-dependent transporter
MLVLGVNLVNIFMLSVAKNINKYRRNTSLFIPIGMTMIGVLIFTGIVMMAAKHLDFTIENIIMILFATILIVLENKRSKALIYLDTRVENSFETYKKYAIKIFMLEIVTVLSISLWMWI